jgi:hypothetical protein
LISDSPTLTASTDSLSPQQILALNDAESSENRIHSDEVAQRYGFSGALVSGVNVFGYLTQPLVRHYGAAFMERGMMDVLFLKPAYQDNLLSIRTENLSQESTLRSHVTSAYNEDETLLAKLESWLPVELPEISPRAAMTPGAEITARPEVSWDAIQLEQPAPSLLWQPTAAENKTHVEVQRDRSPIYQGSEALIHPYYLLEMCNQVLKNLYVMPAWVHTGSKMVIRQGLRIGQDIVIKAVPIKKWERKGHAFIRLYVVFLVAHEVALEVEHTAIYKLAS